VVEQDSIAASVAVILLVILALVFRMMGVAISLVKTKLNKKSVYSVHLAINYCYPNNSGTDVASIDR